METNEEGFIGKDEEVLTKEDEKEMKERLKELGYLD